MNDDQRIKYETLSTRKTNEQKFWHVDSLRQLSMLDDIVILMSNLDWMEYVEMKCMSYDKLIITFLNSLNVDWASSHGGHKVLISFRMFNSDHRLSLREFNRLLHLPVYSDSFRDVPSMWHPNLVWLTITCSKRKSYTYSFGRPRVYNPRQANTMYIYNVNIHRL